MSFPQTTRPTRTAIDDVAPCGEILTPSQLRMVSGGSGETCTGDRNSCDSDGGTTPVPPSNYHLGWRSVSLE